jgi:DNA-binding response OmpR family regulator
MAKIWLVEDDLNLADLTKTVLVKKGFEVEVFHEAIKAIEKAKQIRPDLILMDVSLPGIDGADAVRELKKLPAMKNVPVIFLTGLVSNNEKGHEEMGIFVDGVEYETLGKPYEIEQLLRMVKKAI